MLGLGIEAVEDISLQLGSGGVSKAHAELAGEGRSYRHAMFQACLQEEKNGTGRGAQAVHGRV